MSTPVLDPDLLKAFVAVADHGSFTRAAAALNRTQSAVSMQIKRLEQVIGAELFSRSKVNVALSAAGEGLLVYARRILHLNDEALSRLREGAIEGVVRIGVMDDYGSVVMPPLLSRFVSRYTRIHVEMETGLTGAMIGRLGKSFDLVIAMHPEGSGEGQFLRREQAMWAGGASHAAETLDPIPVALYPQGCLFRKWATEALDRAGRPWRMAFVSHSLAAVEAVVAQGLAVTVVKSGTFPARLRALTDRDGMPVLPGADIRLHRASNISRSASLLADEICQSLSRPEPGVDSLIGRGRLGS
ncbi:LysR family transcriptional regulator [Tardiphaga alba]|uniref:LysR family transcriptional regulator n=1 Tax=Tardiphaga alba TaxID=340268 RepID=A0ABX8AA01_9BRAD|nr:LysR family transcriptional regulator [Tardiphaga alba]QUS40307.1 LysR family transcriptional regulator [Tardiphaga alba]